MTTAHGIESGKTYSVQIIGFRIISQTILEAILKFILLSLFLSFNTWATEISHFNVLPGKLHKGGFLDATPSSIENSDQMLINIVYEIKKKTLVPVPNQFLKGTYEQKLPAIFLDERGYLELEKVKSMRIDEASVVHLGRTTIGTFSDAHLIQILPDNKKSEMILTYHPTTNALGWDSIKLILHTDLPILGDYVIEGKLH